MIEGTGKARRSLGYVTSSYPSPTLGRPVALGLVESGSFAHGRDGRNLSISARSAAPSIAPAVALDPEGKRLHA